MLEWNAIHELSTLDEPQVSVVLPKMLESNSCVNVNNRLYESHG